MLTLSVQTEFDPCLIRQFAVATFEGAAFCSMLDSHMLIQPLKFHERLSTDSTLRRKGRKGYHHFIPSLPQSAQVSATTTIATTITTTTHILVNVKLDCSDAR